MPGTESWEHLFESAETFLVEEVRAHFFGKQLLLSSEVSCSRAIIIKYSWWDGDSETVFESNEGVLELPLVGRIENWRREKAPKGKIPNYLDFLHQPWTIFALGNKGLQWSWYGDKKTILRSSRWRLYKKPLWRNGYSLWQPWWLNNSSRLSCPNLVILFLTT